MNVVRMAHATLPKLLDHRQREQTSKHRLAVLPDLTHYDIFLAPELVQTVLRFLDGK